VVLIFLLVLEIISQETIMEKNNNKGVEGLFNDSTTNTHANFIDKLANSIKPGCDVCIKRSALDGEIANIRRATIDDTSAALIMIGTRQIFSFLPRLLTRIPRSHRVR
jgi:hypothetical protein